MCINYMALNQVTIKDGYLIPLIEKLFDELGRAIIFLKIDPRSRYWQICMHPTSIDKTTIKTHEATMNS